MKDSTKRKLEGKALEMKGIVKTKAGEITNDVELAEDGDVDQVAGKIKHAVGRVEAKLGK